MTRAIVLPGASRYSLSSAWRIVTAALLTVIAATNVIAATSTSFPLDSDRWRELQRIHFGDAKVVFDDRVKVVVPASAEDSLNVPIAVKADEVPGVQEVRVLVDYNPIVKAIEFFPLRARASLTFRIKLQQTSPVRALARTTDGVWHMGAAVVEAAGGGCTAPSLGSAANDWRSTLGQVAGRSYVGERTTRIRLQVQHPMDTGLAPGIPAFYLERLAVLDRSGQELMRINAFEPISENPLFSIDLPGGVPTTELTIRGIDNHGNRVSGRLGS